MLAARPFVRAALSRERGAKRGHLVVTLMTQYVPQGVQAARLPAHISNLTSLAQTLARSDRTWVTLNVTRAAGFCLIVEHASGRSEEPFLNFFLTSSVR